MVGETRTKCGLNGRNSNSPWNVSFIILLETMAYRKSASFMVSRGYYSVRKKDGVSFRDLISDRMICFGIYQAVNFLCIQRFYFYEKSGGSHVQYKMCR
jgi:hypothetical protein